MIKQIFKIIWNQRRSNGWIWMELLVVFVALWYLVDMFVVQFYSYSRPLGYDITNCWRLSFDVYPEDAAEYVSDTTQAPTEGEALARILERLRRARKWIMLVLLSIPHPIPEVIHGHRSCLVRPIAVSSKSNPITNIPFLPNFMMYFVSGAARGSF